MKQRIASVLLACLMLCAMLGVPANAAEAAGSPDQVAPAYLYNKQYFDSLQRKEQS